MDIVHIALFKWKEGISKEVIQTVFNQVKELKEKCQGIIDIYCGENYHNESKGFTHGIVVIAKDQKSLDNYRANPFHKEVADMIESMEDDGLGFDFQNI